MDFPNNTTDSSAAGADEPATSTNQSDDEKDKIGSFIFNNVIKPESTDSNPKQEAQQLANHEREHIVDLVRLQPTKNADLQDQWGLDSGSEVHQYLESQLKEYYYRDSDGYIQATNAAEEFAQDHQDVYQHVTEPDDTEAEDAAPNLRRRDLVVALIKLMEELEHLPTAGEINEHGEYRHQRYREEFGDLFNAYRTAGILPDAVTRQDFYGKDESESESEAEAGKEEDTSGDPETSNQTEPSRQELLDEIKRLDASLDRIPYESDINQNGKFTTYTYRNRFGSWDEALEAASIDKETVLLEDIQKVADTADDDLTQPAMNEHGKYSASMAARFFNSWSEAKKRLKEWKVSNSDEDANKTTVCFDTNTSKRIVNRPSFDAPADVGKSGLIDEIQRFADIIDETPTEELVIAYGRYSGDEYRKAFASWDAALETAGLESDDIPDWTARSHTNVEILDGLRAVADELGHPPTTTEAGEYVEFSPGLASLRFGSWSDALQNAGLDPAERSSVPDSGSTDDTDTVDIDDGETVESDDDSGENNDPIGSVIDDTLENMRLSDDDDSPV